MAKHLLNKTDDLFLQHLKDYSEEPEKKIWSAIDKRLSDYENEKPANSILITSGKAAAVIFLLFLPLLLIDSLLLQKITTKTIVSSNVYHQNKVIQFTSNTSQPVQNLKVKTFVTVIDKKLNSLNNSQKNSSIVEIVPSDNLKNLAVNNKQQKIIEVHPLLFLKNDSGKNGKENEGKVASTIIKLPTKHSFYIIPFFSADHISGRFIEQYEFDNLNKNDYDKRENPDMSFTGGLLASYKLNKRFSILTGASFSISNLSITTTAVKAFADASGVYKFKLATSYGFAEIDKSGITPNAGDSLLVSSASMQFNYISFPLLVSYNLGGKKIKYSVHGGYAINKLVSEKVKAEYEVQNNEENETINKIEGIRKTFFTLNTGAEAKYSVSKKIDISISPELRYGLNSINKKTPIKTFPVNYGLSLDAYLKL